MARKEIAIHNTRPLRCLELELSRVRAVIWSRDNSKRAAPTGAESLSFKPVPELGDRFAYYTYATCLFQRACHQISQVTWVVLREGLPVRLPPIGHKSRLGSRDLNLWDCTESASLDPQNRHGWKSLFDCRWFASAQCLGGPGDDRQSLIFGQRGAQYASPGSIVCFRIASGSVQPTVWMDRALLNAMAKAGPAAVGAGKTPAPGASAACLAWGDNNAMSGRRRYYATVLRGLCEFLPIAVRAAGDSDVKQIRTTNQRQK